MPTYDYRCPYCQTQEERYIRLADFDKQAYNQKCETCGSLMQKQIGIPALQTDTSFMSGSDDGFGTDNFSRQIALKKAAEAGVSVSGMKFHPGLVPKGEPFSPKAWYRDKADVVRKADALGRNVVGSITHNSSMRDEDHNDFGGPYRVSEKCVEPEVKAAIKERLGGKATPKQQKAIVEEMVHKHSGN